MSKTVFSLEIFPPKKTSAIDTIYTTLDSLKDISPDFISVTYGAGGSANNNSTVKIASDIQNIYHIESAAHLPCINLTKDDVINILGELKDNNIKNILALRGDINPDFEPKKDFTHASDLIEFIKLHGDFNIFGACYPEGHSESKSVVDDMHNLKIKVDAGTDRLITQLFLDNEYFYAFRERMALTGINVPIEAGIMPVTNVNQIHRMVSMCGIALPQKFVKILNRYENNPVALRDAGIAYATDQIVDLISQGVDGIHLYTMNNPYIAKKIYGSVASLLDA